MDNVQNYDSYINIPSLQTCRSYGMWETDTKMLRIMLGPERKEVTGVRRKSHDKYFHNCILESMIIE
jgi:hypothetical protein